MKDYNINFESMKQLSPDTYYTSGEFRRLFDQPAKLHGGSLDAFHHRLALFCSFEYDPKDQLYYIEEIYTSPLPDIKDGKYTRLIKILLMDYLSHHPENSAVMTRKYWWFYLSMVNSNFLQLNLNTSTFNNSAMIGHRPPTVIKYNLSTFYSYASSQFTKVLDRALRQLRSQSLITYRYVYLISENGYYSTADDRQEDVIRDIQHDVLQEMKIESLSRLYRMALDTQQEFYSKCNKLYIEYGISRDPDVRVYNNAIQIKYEQGRMERAAKAEIKAAGSELNRLCVDWGLNWGSITKKPVSRQLIPALVEHYIKLPIDK
jgi:hypothetical protein